MLIYCIGVFCYGKKLQLKLDNSDVLSPKARRARRRKADAEGGAEARGEEGDKK